MTERKQIGLDVELFELANAIAEEVVSHHWWWSATRRTVKVIYLRQRIYNALDAVRYNDGKNPASPIQPH